MAKIRTTFCCPNCFAHFQKDDSILMLISGASIVGGGIRWSGNLDGEIDKIKRVKYCRQCRKPLDFHALLRGKLDYRAWGPSCAVLGFLLALAESLFVLGLSLWAGLGLAVMVAVAGGFGGAWLERQRLAHYRLSESDVARFSA
ncbi:MAG: hypothetical protein ACXWJ4_11990 [Methyloceanibacter sp.]